MTRERFEYWKEQELETRVDRAERALPAMMRHGSGGRL